ncbi:hypothetical protein KRX11_10050 [Pasteurellaceae bacterium TAE3-ERU1]|uniref:hypothetical protein n=1 Tax=Spirabiliibacterium mucosae TaxID=28156 RepID=UPI001AAD77BC|nr:hypothetical protein [Spirabiliibacterium mucosae]MBE2898099.1 hypothetical protein [Spirabiliibacterium mucosae]MBV7388975.1 hypothetical protein [Pasteurellaceae bacterium TAE3-ERU1]
MDIDVQLRRWGKGAVLRPEMDYLGKAIGMCGLPKPSGIPMMSDDERELFDNAIAVLIRENYEWYEMIIGYYALDYDLKSLLEYFELGKSRFYEELAKAKNFIYGAVMAQRRWDVKIVKGKAYFYA